MKLLQTNKTTDSEANETPEQEGTESKTGGGGVTLKQTKVTTNATTAKAPPEVPLREVCKSKQTKVTLESAGSAGGAQVKTNQAAAGAAGGAQVKTNDTNQAAAGAAGGAATGGAQVGTNQAIAKAARGAATGGAQVKTNQGDILHQRL